MSILLCVFLGWINVSSATDPHYIDLYNSANQAYKEGAFDTAKTLYTEIAQNGMVSSELFYNLGNTHFREGNIPAAILYFERALRLDPNDEDIRYNLEITRGLLSDKIDPVEEVFFLNWWKALATDFSATFWAVLFIALLFVAAALFTVFSVAENRKLKQLGFLGGITIILSAFVVIMLGRTAHNALIQPEAIVFAPSVNVKSEPGLNATDQFVIHEGLKVRVLGEDGDWTRIELADGNSGWLPTSSIEHI